MLGLAARFRLPLHFVFFAFWLFVKGRIDLFSLLPAASSKEGHSQDRRPSNDIEEKGVFRGFGFGNGLFLCGKNCLGLSL
jgi:hypothetical protein